MTISVNYYRFIKRDVQKINDCAITTITTDNVYYEYPKRIELIYRYLEIFHKDVYKYILKYDPKNNHSFGWWIESYGKDNIKLVSNCAPKRSYEDVDLTLSINNKKNLKNTLARIILTIEDTYK